MFNIEINNKEIIVPKEYTILQAAEKLELKIPRFCFHEKLSIAGNCRMCLVEVEKVNKPIASCAITINDNMQIFTNTILVKKARESVLEILLINHPLDCPICDQGGECDLQDQTLFYGNDKSRFYDIKRAVSDKNISPIIKTIMTRCIHCTRCVRFLNEIGGISDLGITGRGNSMEIGTYINKFINSEISGNIIDLCPVGALTSKSYSFITRSWELKSIETIDIFDSLGSNIILNTRGNNIMRVLPKINEDLNEEWITDKIRFGLDGNMLQRLSFPLYQIKYNYFFFFNFKLKEFFKIKNLNKIKCNWELAFLMFKEQLFFNFCNKNKVLILGNQINLESLNLIKNFYNKFNFNSIFNQYNSIININLDFQYNYYFNFLPKNIENIDVCLLIGVNLRLENPLLNSKLRKSFLVNNSIIGSIGPTLNSIFNLKKLGNSLNKILSILNGKNKFNCYLNLGKNSIIILGNYLSNLNYLFNKLLKFNNIKILNIFPFISSFSLFDFGCSSFNYKLKNYNFFYLLQSDEINIKNELNNFIVYQGSHLDRNGYIADLVFPSYTFLEEKSTFLNLLGNYENLNKVLDLVPFNNFENRNSYLIIINLISYLLNNIFNVNKLNELNINKNLYNFNFDLNLFLKIYNIILNNIILNFYKTDSITRSSLIMSKIIQSNNKININLNV